MAVSLNPINCSGRFYSIIYGKRRPELFIQLVLHVCESIYTVLSRNATEAHASVAILHTVSYISNSLPEALPISYGELLVTGTLIGNEGDK
jgi:hypothetical protein